MGQDLPSTQESTREMLQSMAQYLPDAIKAINSTTANTAQTNQDVSKAISPQAAQLQYDLYKDYGPKMNELGAQLDRQNQLSSSGNELAIAKGPGADLVTEADKLQRQVDPEFYKTREALGNKTTDWLNSYDPTKLTGSETAEVQRSAGRDPNGNVGSAMQTLRNANQFGNAANKKWADFGNAVGQAANALPALKSGFTGFEVATRRALTPNSGDKRLSGPADASQASAQNFGYANGVTNNIAQLQNTALQKKTSVLDDVLKGTEAFSNVAKGVGSFV